MVLERTRLDGKVAIVTGGGRGLGKAMATSLAEAGAEVCIAARTMAQLEAAAAETSDAAGDISGQILQVDGGITTHL